MRGFAERAEYMRVFDFAASLFAVLGGFG